MKAQMQKGFTLIELMIVVAIIGILAAVALPAYQDYTARAKISEVVVQMAAAKTGVAEYYATTGKLDGLNNNLAGLAASSDLTTDYLEGLTVTGTGTGTTAKVTIVANVKGLGNGCDTPAAALTMTGTPNTTTGNLAWTETSDTACTKYVPANFRS